MMRNRKGTVTLRGFSSDWACPNWLPNCCRNTIFAIILEIISTNGAPICQQKQSTNMSWRERSAYWNWRIWGSNASNNIWRRDHNSSTDNVHSFSRMRDAWRESTLECSRTWRMLSGDEKRGTKEASEKLIGKVENVLVVANLVSVSCSSWTTPNSWGKADTTNASSLG